jgi:hypothetical protein
MAGLPHINEDISFAENRNILVVCTFDELFIELMDLRFTLTSPALSTVDKTTVKITITRNLSTRKY